MERDAYEALLDEYEIEIDKLNSKLNKSEDEKEYLYQLMLKECELKNLENDNNITVQMYREGHTFTVIKISKISARGDKNGIFKKLSANVNIK